MVKLVRSLNLPLPHSVYDPCLTAVSGKSKILEHSSRKLTALNVQVNS